MDLAEPNGLWTVVNMTVLIFDYLNLDVVVRKYNHVNLRMRKMLLVISTQSFEDRRADRQWHLAKSCGAVASNSGLLEEFNLCEAEYLQKVENLMRNAVLRGL